MWASFFDELTKIATTATAGTKKEKAEGGGLMHGAVGARPWVTSAVKGSLPAASLAALLPVNPKTIPGMTPEAIMGAQIKAQKTKSKLIAGAAILALARVWRTST